MFIPNTISYATAVVEGRSNVLICNVTSRPASSIAWSYDSAITATQSNSTATNGYYTFSIGMLSIQNVTSSMDGKIVTCIGTPVYGNPIYRSTTLIIQCKLFSIPFFFFTLSLKGLKWEMVLFTQQSTLPRFGLVFPFQLMLSFLGRNYVVFLTL